MTLFYNLWGTIKRIFQGRNLLWHTLAILSTYLIVHSNFDWTYFTWTQNPNIRLSLFPAVIVGGILPIIGPLLLLALGKTWNNLRTTNTAWALGQAALLGSAISSTLKAFTGRIPPELSTFTDISHGFRLGFLRGGIFWGWPSSHTTIAFAMALTLCVLYPRNTKVITFALLYAFYIGIGVSVSIHWFSEFIAGAIIGSVIGIAVGRSFTQRITQ